MTARGILESLNPWSRPQFGVFILAADTDSLERHIRLWRSLHATQITVVCDPFDESLADELDRLDIPGRRRVYHLDADHDVLRSAATWKGWQEELTHFVMVFGDEPQAVLHSILDQVALDPEIVCLLKNAAVFPRWAFTELAGFEGDLHAFVLAHETDKIAYVEEEGFPVRHDEESPAFRRFSLCREGNCLLE
ncbi:MAG TPA: hypothetical protein VIT91_13045 [Chthoniobacterales bacterium]